MRRAGGGKIHGPGQQARRAKYGDVNGRGAKEALGWYGEIEVQAIHRQKELAPWKKVSYDHEAAVKAQRGGYALKSKGDWPTQGGMEGAVPEWHGRPFGPTRVPRAAKSVYGKGWELVVEDPIAREAYVRGIAKPARQQLQAPWEREGAKDGGAWTPGMRKGPNTHKVLHHM